MQRKFKQWVSTNKANYLSPWIIEHKNTKTYGIGNPGPGLG